MSGQFKLTNPVYNPSPRTRRAKVVKPRGRPRGSDTAVKTCRKCSCELVVGVNWGEGVRRGGSRICKGCNSSRAREYMQQNREKLVERTRAYREQNRERVAEHARAYREQNREKCKEQCRAYRKQNREKVSARCKKRYQTDTSHKLRECLRSRLRSAIKGNFRAGSAVRDLGCTIPELKQHLESKFTPEMTWENWGTYWHIDHIKPLAAFDLTNREELLQACHWSNLQPLEATENLRKGARYCDSGED